MGGNVVLGGVASAWGDNVDTSNGAVGLLYPRALAVGEKLWSPAAATALFDPRDGAAMRAVENRMALARCVLVQVHAMHARGVRYHVAFLHYTLLASPRSLFPARAVRRSYRAGRDPRGVLAASVEQGRLWGRGRGEQDRKSVV